MLTKKIPHAEIEYIPSHTVKVLTTRCQKPPGKIVATIVCMSRSRCYVASMLIVS